MIVTHIVPIKAEKVVKFHLGLLLAVGGKFAADRFPTFAHVLQKAQMSEKHNITTKKNREAFAGTKTDTSLAKKQNTSHT